jgi:prepilin-type N-terminal cleavage/methylation domain-containing protein
MPARKHAARAGFTLAEMLIAATLGALLLAAAASTAGTFTETMAQLHTDTSDNYEKVVARIDRDVRYSWWADVPDRHRLQVVDSDNLVTEYHLVGNSLLVTRPDGSSGSVITGLSGLNFEAETLQRLRSGSTTRVYATMDSQAATPLVLPTNYSLGSGTIVAISFMGPSDAGARSVAGVNDQYLDWDPATFTMNLARSGAGTLTVRLYYAFGPGRAEPRPGSSAITSWTVNLATLPAAVVLASPPSVPRTVYAVPGVPVNLSVPVLARALDPGVAYTLTLEVSAGSTLVIPYYPGTVQTEQMFKVGAGGWAGVPGTMAFAVRGNATCTTTEASDMATQVRTTMLSSEGGTYVGSACVYSQVLADDPWLGVVPGELPGGP